MTIHSAVYGLIGKNIAYSFSKKYFAKKFQREALHDCEYVNFDIQNIESVESILKELKTLKGLNVTIPYKEAIVPYLDKLSKSAKKIGAVNCIKITKKRKLIGYNTDWYGFGLSLQPLLTDKHKKALILGTGGASKAVAYALKKKGISVTRVSRKGNKKQYSYSELSKIEIEEHTLIINTTPLGTHPDVLSFPPIPYQFITERHLCYDLIYNPEESLFLKKAKKQGAQIKNGYEMLVLQAEKSWKIWNK